MDADGADGALAPPEAASSGPARRGPNDQATGTERLKLSIPVPLRRGTDAVPRTRRR
jgi:hypothetical protein